MNLKKVDKATPVPLYYQLKMMIREKIENKEWGPSDQIPSESFLSDYHQISIMTVRQAINELRNEGLLYKVKGKGVFVSKPKLERDLSELTSLTEKLINAGLKVERRVLDVSIVPAPSHVAEKLEIHKNDDVIRLERLMSLENRPFYHDINFLPHDLCGTLFKENFGESLIYRLIEDQLGLKLDYANLTFEAIACQDYRCRLLKIKKGSPVIHINQVTYLLGGRPVQLFDALSRSDVFKYSLIRRRPK